MHRPVHQPSRLFGLIVLTFLLGISTAPLYAQDTPARKLSWAAKVQAYQPLSWLAEPLNGEKDFPLTPRFWTGEVELGFSERSSVQVSVGLRYRKQPWLNTETNTSEDVAKGIKLYSPIETIYGIAIRVPKPVPTLPRPSAFCPPPGPTLPTFRN